MKTTTSKTQLHLNIRLPRERRRSRPISRNRAQWWFARMREVVLSAPSEPKQGSFVLSA